MRIKAVEFNLFILSKRNDDVVMQNAQFDFRQVLCHYWLLWGHLQWQVQSAGHRSEVQVKVQTTML